MATYQQMQRECEMRAADNLELCKEIDALNARLKESEGKLEDLKLSFAASENLRREAEGKLARASIRVNELEPRLQACEATMARDHNEYQMSLERWEAAAKESTYRLDRARNAWVRFCEDPEGGEVDVISDALGTFVLADPPPVVRHAESVECYVPGCPQCHPVVEIGVSK